MSDAVTGGMPPIGRRSELEQLHLALGTVGDHRSATVLVGGPAGMGKTTLLAAFLAELPEDVIRLVGACVDTGDLGVPYVPFHAALRGLYGQIPEDDIHLLLEESTAVAAACGLGGSANGDVPPARHDRVFPEMLHLVGSLSERAQLVIVLEDLHWADHETRALFSYLARSCSDQRVLLIGTFRVDHVGRRHPLRSTIAELAGAPSVRHLELSPFDAQSIVRFAANSGQRVASESDLDEILERSGGNPLHVRELLGRAGSDGGLSDLLAARIDVLAAPVADVVRAAAVIGDRVDIEMLRAMFEVDDPTLEAALRAAVDARVLVAEGNRVRFDHALLREAAESSLLPSERVRLNVAAARFLEQHDEIEPAERHTRLAQHYHGAGDDRMAATAAIDAARTMSTAAAPGAVFAQVRQAITWWPPRWPDRQSGTGSQSAAVERIWEELAESDGSWNADRGLVRAMILASSVASLAGYRDDSIRWATRSVDAAKRLGDGDLSALALERLSRSMYHDGLVLEGFEAMDRSREIAEGLPFDEDSVRIRLNWVGGALETFRETEALDAIPELRETLEPVLPFTRRELDFLEGTARMSIGDDELGRVLLERSLAGDYQLRQRVHDPADLRMIAGVSLAAHLEKHCSEATVLDVLERTMAIAEAAVLPSARATLPAAAAADHLVRVGRWSAADQLLAAQPGTNCGCRVSRPGSRGRSSRSGAATAKLR